MVILADVNECQDPRYCKNGVCINTPGSFHCICTQPLTFSAALKQCVYDGGYDPLLLIVLSVSESRLTCSSALLPATLFLTPPTTTPHNLPRPHHTPTPTPQPNPTRRPLVGTHDNSFVFVVSTGLEINSFEIFSQIFSPSPPPLVLAECGLI